MGKQKLILLVLFIGLTLFYTYPVGDADLGWHLRYGESFLKTGNVMRDNQFSWVLPDYRWANHSWGFDVIEAALFNGDRFWLLSLAGGVVIAASFVVLLPQSAVLATLLALTLNLTFGGVLLNLGLRSNLFSLFFTAVLWKIILDKKRQNRLYFLPFLFLIWANTHGQFVFGLVILGLSLAPRFRETKYLFLFLACMLMTLINPFGLDLWSTALSHFNAPELKNVYEWMPIQILSPLGFLFCFYAGFFAWWVKTTKPTWGIVLPIAATTLYAISSRRMIPYFFLLLLPIFVATINKRITQINQNRLIYTCITIFLLISFYSFNKRDIFSQSWESYCQKDILCSEKAIDFIRNNHVSGKLWNAYRLGGYLDYRLPELKTMIDGRMTLWRDENGTSAFEQYSTMVYAQAGSKQLFLESNPDYVLIHPQYPLAQVLLNTEKWPVIFQDDHVLLFQNPHLH